ncbi:MAG: hypothetical protein QM724_08485 [Flavobacteriales bacterium]
MTLTTAHSLWLAPLCVLLGIGCAWSLYRRTGASNGWPPRLQWAMGALRASVIALLAFFLLEPMVRIFVREVRKPVIVLAHDGSSSLLATGDTVAFRTAYAKALEGLSAELGEAYDVRPFTYGSTVTDGLDFAQREAQTDIDQLFRAVQDRFAGPDLGAVIIDGDGIYNRGRDPRLAAERLGVPVFTIALGDTTVRPDLVLRNVDHNRITYLGNEFPVVARVEARHLRGKGTRVSVLHDGQEVAGKDVAVTGDPVIAEVPLMVKATAAGLQRYTVRLRPVEGEVTEANNAQTIYIDVLDDRQKVLILAQSPHPDVAALRAAMDGLEGYVTDVAYAGAFTGKVEEYDLVVLHQLPSTRSAIQPILQRIVEKNIPTWTILGLNSDLSQVNDLGSGVEVSGGQRTYTDAQAAVAPDLALFTLEPEDVRTYERFPPLQVPFGQYALGRGAVAVMTQKIGVVRTSYPLIAIQPQGERHAAITCGEGLWRWRLADQQQNNTNAHFDKLVRKIVQYLALKQDKSRFRVRHPQEFAQNEPVAFDAELYNASYERVNAPEATITLKDEEGKELAYTFSRTTDAYHLEAGVLPAGRYTWTAAATLNGERLAAKGELLVKPMVAEQLTAVADHALWQGISARTEGISVPPTDVQRIAAAIRERKALVPRSYAHASFSDLIGLRWLFFVLLGLLTLEWVLRRRNGSY